MNALRKVIAGVGAAVLATGVAVAVAPSASATGAVYGTMTVSPAGPYSGGEIVTISYAGLDSTVSGSSPGNGGGMFIGYCVGSGNLQAGTGACGPFEGGGPFPSPAGPSSTLITGAYYYFGAPTIVPNGSVRFKIPTKGAAAGFSDYPGYVCDNTTQCNITVADFSGDGPVQIPIAYAESTSTLLAATPASGAATGDSVSLTATVTPSSATGSVQFKDGATNIGAPVTVSGGTATTSTSFTGGSHNLSAVFTGTGVYGDSTGTLAYSVGAAATTTSLSTSNAAPSAFATVTFHADVNAGATALGAGKGSVTFKDGATTVCGNVALTATGADCVAASGFSEGAHTITATFAPAVAAQYGASTSAGVDLTVGPPAGGTAAPKQQNVTAFVEVGTLSISTPFNTTTNPFQLGSAVMNADGTLIEAGGSLGSQDAQGHGITITDLRAGDPGWTANATISDFSGPGTISGDAVSFTPAVDVAGSDATVTPSTIAQLGGIAEPFATAPAGNGSGTTFIDAVLRLGAPTTTPAGLYTATLTLTVG